MTNEASHLSVIITTYKTRDYLRAAIESIIRDLDDGTIPYRIIVVDNNSQDGTVEMLNERYPSVCVIANTKNLGPAKAFNQGIRAASGSKYVLIMNSDIVVLEGCLKSMYSYLQKHDDIDGVVPDILNPDLTRQYYRISVDVADTLFLSRSDYSKPFKIAFAGTGFQMARYSAFQTVGLFDEHYYFYNEDLDWAHRAKRAGLEFRLLPSARIIHYGSGGRSQNSSRITEELFRSNIYYYRKFYNPVIVFLAYHALKADIAVRIRSCKKKLADLSQDTHEARSMRDNIEVLKKARIRMKEEYYSKHKRDA